MIDHIQAVIAGLPAHKNPFFSDLEDGAWDQEDFTETQVQFFSAVQHFNRPMRALALRTPLTRNRKAIEQNIDDELGLNHTLVSHEESFLLFLLRLGDLSEKEVRNRPVWPELIHFNRTLDTVCSCWDYREAAVYMGVIELMFSDYSGRIGRGILKNGWLLEEDLIHYTQHEGLDLKHATDFFQVAAPDWPHHRSALESAIEQSAEGFDQLYRSLHERRAIRVR